MVSETQKKIYNKFLIISRRGKPFKLKKDFSNLDDEKIMVLEKLEKLFDSYPNLKQEDFFTAPYKIYPDDDYYPLEFFTKPKAIKCYTQYVKQLEIQDPDSEDSLRRLIESLKFVYGYCKEKNLQLSEYELNIEGTMPCFVEHLKTHKINYYTLHALGFKFPKDNFKIYDFIFSDFGGVFSTTRNKFFSSSKMKKLSKLAVDKIKNTLHA